MTISTTTRKAGPYLGTGLVSAYPFTFKVLAAADVLVTVRDTSQAETVLADPADYTVALNADQNSNPGGTVTLTAPLADGYYLVITSDQPATQPVDLISQGGFYPDVIDEALDRQTILVQQLAEQLDRNVRLPVSVDGAYNLELPLPTAGRSLVGWDDAGTALRSWTLAELNVDGTFGKATGVGDGDTIAHGLTAAPSTVICTPTVVGEMISVTGSDATNFTVTIKKHDGTPGTAQDVNWIALV
jgi:hypothetical protein